jgi:hypothetical protein
MPVAGDWDGGSAVSSSLQAAATGTKAGIAGTMSVASVQSVHATAAVAASLVQIESAVGDLRSAYEGIGASNITGAEYFLVANREVDATFASDDGLDARRASEDSQVDVTDRLAIVESQIDLLLSEFVPIGRVPTADATSGDGLTERQAEELLAYGLGEGAALDGIFEAIGRTV